MNLGRARAQFDDRPGGRPGAARRGAQRGQAGARRAARPGPRPAPGRAHRPRPGRGAVRRSPPGRPVPVDGRRRPVEPAAAAPRRGGRLLRGRRGADQRRQARPGDPAPRWSSRRRDGTARRRGHRRRRRRRRPGPGSGLRGPAPTGSPASTARCTSTARPAGRPCSPWSCRARRDRRGLGAAARGPGPAARRRRLRGGRRGRRRRAAAARGRRATGPTSCVVDVRMPPTHTDEGLRAALVIRQRSGRTSPCWCSRQYVEERYATELLAGDTRGVGYLLKDRVADVGEFVDALRRVGGRRHRARPRGRRPAARPQPARRPARRADPARAARCSALMAEGRSNAAIAAAAGRQRRRGREAREQHLHQARAAPRPTRPPPGAGRAALPGRPMSQAAAGRSPA